MKIKIFNPKEDMYGNQRENIFIVMGEDNNYLGSGFVFPKLSPAITPKHPLNIFMEMHLDEAYLNHDIGEKLFFALSKRAEELRSMTNIPAYVYYGTDDPEHPLLKFYKQHGFDTYLPSYLLKRVIPDNIVSDQPYRVEVTQHLEGEFKAIVMKEHNKTFISQLTDDNIHELSHQPDFQNITLYSADEMVANMMMYTDDEYGKNLGRIENIMVRRKFRKQGVGAILLQLAYQYFKEKLIEEMSLEVWEANDNALKFYEHMGFKIIKETEYYVGKLYN